MKTIDCDIFEAGNFRHKDAFADVNLDQFRIRIYFSEVPPYRSCGPIHLTPPGVFGLNNFLRCLFFIEGLTVEINISAMMPLTVVQPAA